MHYPEFHPESIDQSTPTIVTKNPIYQHAIGTYEHASKEDFEKICRKYECEQCPNELKNVPEVGNKIDWKKIQSFNLLVYNLTNCMPTKMIPH